MNFITDALSNWRSTILFGSLGLDSSLIESHLNSIPELEPISDSEPLFLHHSAKFTSRILKIWIEPPFDAVLSSHPWTIVFTSHLNFQWDPITSRVVHCHTDIIDRPLSNTILEDESKICNLSACESTHEAFIQLCLFLGKNNEEWFLVCPDDLRQKLQNILPVVGGGPFVSYLLRIL